MKINQQSAASMLVEQIRKDILGGEYQADERVRQESVAEKYGVSRIPVREALMQLEAQGLLSFVPQKGFVVRGMSRAEIVDVFELRLKIEPDLIAEVVEKGGDNVFSDAASQLEQMNVEHKANGVSEAFVDGHIEFHLALIQASERERSKQIARHLFILAERYIRHHQLVHGEYADREHQEILGACLARNSEEAAELVRKHIQQTLEELLCDFDEEG